MYVMLSISSAPLPYRQMKWPTGYNVIIPGGGLLTRQQRQHYGNFQLCPCHLPECGEEFPAPGTPGVSLHTDPVHYSPPQRLGGHLQGISPTYHSCVRDIVQHNHSIGPELLNINLSIWLELFPAQVLLIGHQCAFGTLTDASALALMVDIFTTNFVVVTLQAERGRVYMVGWLHEVSLVAKHLLLFMIYSDSY